MDAVNVDLDEMRAARPALVVLWFSAAAFEPSNSERSNELMFFQSRNSSMS